MNKKVLIFLGLGISAIGAWYFYDRKRRNDLLLNSPKNSTLLPDNPISNIITDTNLVIKSMTNAGIRNFNPLNIEYNPNNNWEGQTGRSGRWAVFSSDEYGFRAGAKLLKTYASKYGINTIAGIVKKWAPPPENDTQNYINFVSKKTGILAFTPVTVKDYPIILQAMAKMETGKDYPLSVVQKGVTMS